MARGSFQVHFLVRTYSLPKSEPTPLSIIHALLQSVANKKSKDMKVVDQPFHEDFSEMKPSGS